jgi:hypothetical protein
MKITVNKDKKMRKTIRKGKANNGMSCKDYWFLTDNKIRGYELAIIICRLQLIPLSDKEDYLKTLYAPVKRYKDKLLVQKTFSIKVSTLKEMLNWIESNN